MTMARLTFIVMSLTAGSAVHAQNDAKKELEKLQGTWQIVSGEENKEPLPELIVQNLKLVIKGNEMTVKGVENVVKKAGKIILVIDPSTTPKTIDLKIEAGSDKGTTLEGIYEFKGDEVRMCLSTASGSRPTEFATKENSKLVLFVLKRDKE